jgi:3-phenylpropionate/trans-cinnamate dioxygenase ferredoxin subunit
MELVDNQQQQPPRAGAQRFIVGRPEDVPEGERIIVTVGDREIGVFRIDGEFYALLHRCPHLGGPLCKGEIIGLIESDGPGDLRLNSDQKILTCPWHNWEFDIKTGQSYWNPLRTRARRFPVEVKEGSELENSPIPTQRVPGPYKAETMPIDIEGEYLVVTVRLNPPVAQHDARP